MRGVRDKGFNDILQFLMIIMSKKHINFFDG